MNALIAERRALQTQVRGILESRGVALDRLLATRDQISDLKRQLGKNSAALADLDIQLGRLTVNIQTREAQMKSNQATLAGIARQQYESSNQTAVSQIMFGSANFDQVVSRIAANQSLSTRAHNLVVALREEQAALTKQSDLLRHKQAETQGLQAKLTAQRQQLDAAAAEYQARIDSLDAESHALLDQVNQLDTAIAAAIGPPPPGATLAQDVVISIIRAAALRYGADADQLVRVATCESSLNPRAYHPGSGASGLFQFLPGTFYAHGGKNIWDAADQADIAAKMFSQGLAYMWTCR